MLKMWVIFIAMMLANTHGALHNTSIHKSYHHHMKSMKSHGHKSFETAVRTYDKDLFHAALNYIDTHKVEIKGFYHVSTNVGHWNEVLEEHLMVMDGKRFATNLFSSKSSLEQANNKQKNIIGAKLTTGWSSVLEIVNSIEINFDSASDPSIPTVDEKGQPLESLAYQNMTTMLANIHLRGGNEKLKVKPYHTSEIKLHTTTSTTTAATSTSTTSTAMEELQELRNILGELSSLQSLHQYCQNEVKQNKQAFVFMMHNQETNCSAHIDKHSATGDYYSNDFFLHDIVNSFIIEFPSICLSALLSGYATCGSDFENTAYDSNIWWANCAHINRLPAPTTDNILQHATTVSYRDAIQLGRETVRNFLFGALVDTPTTTSTTTPSAPNKSTSVDSNYSKHCAYNLHSGVKTIDPTVRIVQGKEVVVEGNTCSRSEYRFSLIDVLSGLHDDGVLHNRRYNMPSIVTELTDTNMGCI